MRKDSFWTNNVVDQKFRRCSDTERLPPPPMATPPMRVVVFRDKANTEICAIEGHISLACSGEIDKAKLGVPQAHQLALRAALHRAHGAWNSCK